MRDAILDYLQKNRHATVAELSEMLHVTKADVRYHLKELITSGEIEKAAIIKPNWKGRPTRLYQLADRAKPGNYQQLAEALLSFCESRDMILPMISQLAAHMADKIPPAKHRATQLNRLVNYFTANAYHATWEAYANGPRIIFRNCPYAGILPQYPLLCEMDSQIIEKYLNLHFSQASRINLEKDRRHACVFLVESRS